MAGEPTVLEMAAAIRAGAAELACDRRVKSISPQTAERMLDQVIAAERSIVALKLQLASRFAENHGAKAADDLARKTGTSRSKAKRTVETAKKLRDQPPVEDALNNGELSEDQAELIADAAAANPSATGSLLKKAKESSVNDLRDACGRAKAAADADEEATHRRVHASRFFRTATSTDGAFCGSLRGTTVDGSDFMAHLQPFRDRVFDRNRKAGIRETSEQMDFDALMEMARAAYANTTSDRGEAAPKGPKTVYVVVDFDAMVGRARPGQETAYVAGFGPVPVSVVRDVMDDTFLVGVVMKGTEVTKVKRFGRRFSAEIRDALLVKHRFRCATPGCTNWARLELDHKHPVGKGGETSYANGQPLCDTCHDEKTARDRLLWDDTG